MITSDQIRACPTFRVTSDPQGRGRLVFEAEITVDEGGMAETAVLEISCKTIGKNLQCGEASVQRIDGGSRIPSSWLPDRERLADSLQAIVRAHQDDLERQQLELQKRQAEEVRGTLPATRERVREAIKSFLKEMGLSKKDSLGDFTKLTIEEFQKYKVS